MVSRAEFREAIDMRSSAVGLALVVLAGALLRFWNLQHGSLVPIELQILDPVVQVLHTGSFRTQALTRPTLPVYLQVSVSIVHFMWGAISGAWRSLADFNHAQVVGWSRGVSALLGTLVVFLVYQIGMRWGGRHALLAAGLMAVTPTHVAVSRQAGDGALLTCLVALTLLTSIAASERRRPRAFIVAGVAAGLAAATHYAGALTIITPLVAVWMTREDDSSRLWRAAAVVAAALLAFVLATPLSLTNLPAFLDGFAAVASPAGIPDGVDRIDLLRGFVWTWQWPAAILAFSGVCLGIVRAVTGPGHTRWTLLVSFPVVYFTLVAWHGAGSETTLSPLLPAAAVMAAIAVISGVSQLRRFDIPRAARTALIAALTVLAMLPPAVLSIELVRQAGREPTAAATASPSPRDTGR